MLSQVSITLSMRFLVSVRLLSLLLVVVIANVLVHLLLVSLVHPMCKNDVLLSLTFVATIFLVSSVPFRSTAS